jgi:hypothetical protein
VTLVRQAPADAKVGLGTRGSSQTELIVSVGAVWFGRWSGAWPDGHVQTGLFETTGTIMIRPSPADAGSPRRYSAIAAEKQHDDGAKWPQPRRAVAVATEGLPDPKVAGVADNP